MTGEEKKYWGEIIDKENAPCVETDLQTAMPEGSHQAAAAVWVDVPTEHLFAKEVRCSSEIQQTWILLKKRITVHTVSYI